ncbi:type VII secretion integral membrane protein EccD [Mycobacterium sp. ACS1612]|uniref:type VII secretion integral membrane protein EccD n=1 Tax=Mycobacterium sp. ACS1612 TaxID=1834117 RepID=UPI001E392088|nr:type VII secretion integral membrane protein EccD [Mycobacterium sp. ACS1612]
MCRLAVQHDSRCVALALPANAPVGVLLPAVVDLVGASVEGRRWHLSRVGQPRLDEAMSLRDNAVHDGELLLLTTDDIPPPAELPDGPAQAVIAAAEHHTVPAGATTAAACLSVALLGVTASMWGGITGDAVGHVVATGITATAAAVGAVVLRRDPLRGAVLAAIAVMFGAVAGFLAVPSGPPAARLLLASAVGATVAILLRRIADCADISLSAMATAGILTSVATVCGVGGVLPVAATGAVLASSALATLGVAARLSIAATGLAPRVGDPDAGEDHTVEPRARAAQRALTGLVIGSAAATAVGAGLVVWDSIPERRSSAAVFALVVASVLTLRARTHIDIARRAGLIVCGAVSFAAGCAIVVAAAPHRAQWVCLLVAVAVAAMLFRPSGAANPLVRRTVDVLEYAVLAAVVPTACWVGGAYAMLRGLSLS